MKYKMLVLDIDGTLLNQDGIITKRTKASLLKAQQMGVKLVLASGRPTYGVLPFVKELEIDKNGGYYLSYNGGQIFSAENNELLFEKRINPAMIPYLEHSARKRNMSILTYHKDSIYTNDASNVHVISEANLNNMKIVEAQNFSEAITFYPCKCMFVSDDEVELVNLQNRFKKRLAGDFDFFRSEKYFLEAVPPFINKGNTIGLLLEKLKISPEDIMAIGDGVCDVSMIQFAGLGIAMTNAQDSVRICADYVTLPNNEDGVAEAVEKFIISEIRSSVIPLDNLNKAGKHALMGNLGIQYTFASKDRVEATMPVNERTRQPFGILHGGATLALAETIAGLGSMILCEPDELIVGMQVSGNHVSSAHEGDTVRAVATIIHKGRTSHVWNVDVFTSTDKLVSSMRVLNSIIKKH
jgi:Cof subfamily protein (haloacid dehalogenase superfamily)